VEDSGPGIPEAERARVLDRFVRLPGAPSTGSGLGLAIVKAVADLHGATLRLDASPALGGLRVRVAFVL
jgi:two-component system, OmpR family, sensor kinase